MGINSQLKVQLKKKKKKRKWQNLSKDFNCFHKT